MCITYILNIIPGGGKWKNKKIIMHKIPPSTFHSLNTSIVNVLHKLNGVYAACLFLFMTPSLSLRIL